MKHNDAATMRMKNSAANAKGLHVNGFSSDWPFTE